MLDGDRGVRYRLWAPSAKSLSLVVASDGDRKVRMQRTADGWFECVDLHSRAGTRYWYELDDDARVPDPAARFMPHGPHAPSEVVDPASFAWQPGTETCVRPQREYVFYELHVGTFTPEGTFAAAASHLEYLAELGVTAIELMPVAQAAGSKNWGYDGVGFYAPSCAYGRPDDLKAFVARAHVLGLCVILDVVYNHFGPEGNYLHRYAPSFFDERCPTPWGPALDLTSSSNEPARAYIIENACYWLAEYRFDGLRLDAVSALHEDARRPLLEQLSVRAREAAGRPAFIAIEHEHLDPELVSNEKAPCDAAWSDEVHHSLHTAISSERDGYYREHAARPIARLGRALAEERSRFVQCLQNHDHIGNRPFGERITALAEPDAVRAATAVVLLAPSLPLLFMGQEWGASTSFFFFCDFEPELSRQVRAGRHAAFREFTGFSDPLLRERVPDPSAASTFSASVLDWGEREFAEHRAWLTFHRHLLQTRHTEIVPLIDEISRRDSCFETRGERGLIVRWQTSDGMLALDANLGPAPCGGFEQTPPGRVIYASSGSTYPAGIAPPWSVRWALC